MPASTGLCNAAMQQAQEQVEQRLQHEQLLRQHRAPLARRTARMADRHRWQRQLLGPALETALRQLHSAGAQPQNAVVPSSTPALGASGASTG